MFKRLQPHAYKLLGIILRKLDNLDKKLPKMKFKADLKNVSNLPKRCFNQAYLMLNSTFERLSKN